MKSRSNETCQCCVAGVNALNGRYCTHLRRLVEHAKEPPCVEQDEEGGGE